MRVFGLLALAGAALLLAAAVPASGSVASIVTRDTFYSMLRQGHHGGGDGGCDGGAFFYSYDAFVEAASTFRGFGTTGDQATRRRELAAFFAQTSHETTGYCWVKQRSPAGDRYYGRGPMQLTHEHNYRRAGDALGLDLVRRPDLVSTDPVVAFKTAIWFWMTPRHGAHKTPSCHAVMTGGWRPSRRDRRAGRLPGYGMTTNIISGGLACGKRHGTPQGRDRVGYYKRCCRLLRVRLGRNVACINQKPYGHGG
ncbi:hypothetical protein CFC21_068819 [Triticum aestivum]|uniref:chitinase n=2 Tax=Triticum aestivum TaxID=4565 RepID=A0A9R1HCN5_WHEAT|nr:chitinase 11-like [Triticum aestivum]KAF7062191.1 hypothetical protein CFC21_068819 [Triticum aestivum]